MTQLSHQLNLLESDYFGICFKVGNQTLWLDMDKKLNAQLTDCVSNEYPHLLQFAVKFYPPDPSALFQSFTRYLLCLQIKRDLRLGEPIRHCCKRTLCLIVSYIAQG